MPLEITFLDDGGVFLNAIGVLCFDDISNANGIIYSSPENVRALRYLLCDYSELEDLQITMDEFRTLAVQEVEAARQNPSMPVAVIGNDALGFELLLMLNAYAAYAGFETRVFHAHEPARAWIHRKLNSSAALEYA